MPWRLGLAAISTGCSLCPSYNKTETHVTEFTCEPVKPDSISSTEGRREEAFISRQLKRFLLVNESLLGDEYKPLAL